MPLDNEKGELVCRVEGREDGLAWTDEGVCRQVGIDKQFWPPDVGKGQVTIKVYGK